MDADTFIWRAVERCTEAISREDLLKGGTVFIGQNPDSGGTGWGALSVPPFSEN
jgi:hypothetical protein